MTEETRQQIIKTPTDQLSADLISEYSNSAHGVPRDLEDLRLILPRYLDLMAQDEMVDDIGVGTELLRFGQAVQADRAVYTSAQWQALDDWAEQILWHYAYADFQELDNLHAPLGLIDTMMAGGWEAAHITGVMDAIFQHPKIGQGALAMFLRTNQQGMNAKSDIPRLDWYGTGYASEVTRAGLANWFNSAALRDVLQALAMQPDADPNDQTFAAILLTAQGRFTAASFPVHRFG